MKLREAEQLAKAVLVADAARGQSLRPHRSALHSLPLGVPMAGTLRQSEPQGVILESHTFQKHSGSYQSPSLKHELSVTRTM